MLKRSNRIIKTLKTQHEKSNAQLKNNYVNYSDRCVNNSLSARILSFLNEDQIKIVNTQYKKTPKWLNSTIIKVFKLKFACELFWL